MCWMNNLAALFRSFGYAAKGIAACVKERNFRVHIVAAVYVPLFARHFLHTAEQWTALVLTIALVMVAEMVNTAIEQTVDNLCPEHHPVAGRIKDVTAGAVLVAAIAAVIVAVILFADGQAWTTLFTLWREQWWRPLLFAASVPFAAWFVLHK